MVPGWHHVRYAMNVINVRTCCWIQLQLRRTANPGESRHPKVPHWGLINKDLHDSLQLKQQKGHTFTELLIE